MPSVTLIEERIQEDERNLALEESIEEIKKEFLCQNMLRPTFRLDFKARIDYVNAKYKEELSLFTGVQRRLIFFINNISRTIDIQVGIPLKNKNFYFEADGDFEIRTFEDDIYLIEKYKYGKLEIHEI
jgi:hypothetical protein